MPGAVDADLEKTDKRVPSNGLSDALLWVARHHGIAGTKAEMLRGLPVEPGGLPVSLAEEAAERLGLRVHYEHRPVQAVPAVTYPVVLVTETEPAMVVLSCDRKAGTARIVVPEISETARTVQLDALGDGKSSLVIFVSPVERSMDAEPGATARRHWFWSAVGRLWPNYLQVVIAALIGNILALASPLFIMNVYDRVIPNLAIPTLWALTAGVVIAFAFDFLLKILRMQIVDETGRRVDMAVAGRIFDHLLATKLADRQASTGASSNRIRDLDMIRDALTSSTVIALTDVLFIGVFVWVMWILVGPLAIVPALAVPLVIGVTALIQIPLTRALTESQSDAARRQALLVETLSSLETIKASGGESWFRRAWDRAVAAASRSSTRARKWGNLAAAFTALVFQSVSIVIVVWGVFLVLAGNITIGALIAANILAGRVLAPLNNIAQTLTRILHAKTALRGLNDIMRADAEHNVAARAIDGGGDGSIALDQVTFSYPGSKVPALASVSFSAKRGDKIGVIGRVGSGKSTLVRILAGLYEPEKGAYLLSGIDTRQYATASLRAHVGLCLQDAELFTGTVRENILIGHPHASAEELESAVHLSGLGAFSSQHPEGLELRIEEFGRNLSGGQKQAVALARCLVRAPKILCLDEPTAYLDVAAERHLCAQLQSIAETGVTIILATHRDAPLDVVDRLLLFDKGRLLMDGPKQEVIERLKAGPRARSESGFSAGGGDHGTGQ